MSHRSSKPLNHQTLSSAMEDYLKAVYELGEQGVKTQALADRLGVSPASVTGMLKKLAGLNLVVHERYKGVGLTSAGRKIALETLRHHRLIETYLAQALGYELHELHDEADTLEHHISEDFEERIAALLGNPSYDPHGDPIPRRDGSMPEAIGQPLTAFEVGNILKITRLIDQDREVLVYLMEQQLLPQTQVVVQAREPFEGPLTLRVAGRDVVLAFALAQQVQAVKV